LGEGVEGVLQGKGANGHLERDPEKAGFVMEVEHRRKSGRGVREWYFVPTSSTTASSAKTPTMGAVREKVVLLEDLPAYKASSLSSNGDDDGTAGADEKPEGTTFELGLTEKQRQAREGVVLPYFDAQKGGGEGGRILYDMGEEDDFDEEEDEI
jgi:elongator complex protein 5